MSKIEKKAKETKHPKMTEYGSDGKGGHQVRIENLTEDEFHMIERMLLGHTWVKANPLDKKLMCEENIEEIPKVHDEEMLPFWKKWMSDNQQMEMFNEDWPKKGYYPSILIGHLCGYGYTPENYKRMAERLESYGFECMRSKRDKGGKYIEKWVIDCFVFAENELKVAIENYREEVKKAKEVDYVEDNEILDKVIWWLCQHVSFGTLDISIQRAAATID